MYCIPVGDLKYCTSTTYTCRGSEVLGRTSRRCQSSGPWPARRGRPVALLKLQKTKLHIQTTFGICTDVKNRRIFPTNLPLVHSVLCIEFFFIFLDNFVPKTLFPKPCSQKLCFQKLCYKTVLAKTVLPKTFFPKTCLW